jgi:hypothetical protein
VGGRASKAPVDSAEALKRAALAVSRRTSSIVIGRTVAVGTETVNVNGTVAVNLAAARYLSQ